MTAQSEHHSEYENKWHTSDVMRFMLAGMVIGSILILLILNVTNTPADGGTSHCGGTTDYLPDDSMHQLNDDTLSMMKDAFKWGGAEVGLASSGELGRLPFRVAFNP